MRDQALLVEKGSNIRLRQYLVEHRIVAVDDLFRRIGRSKNAVPQIDIEVGDAEFCERRHICRLRRPFLAAHGEDTDLSGFCERKRRMDRQEHGRDVSARQILHCAGRP